MATETFDTITLTITVRGQAGETRLYNARVGSVKPKRYELGRHYSDCDNQTGNCSTIERILSDKGIIKTLKERLGVI